MAERPIPSAHRIGTVRTKDVSIEIDGHPHIWTVKALSYAKKLEIAKVMSKLDASSIREMQDNPSGATISGEVAMDMIQYQVELLMTNIIKCPDGGDVTREYVMDLEDAIARQLLEAISPDMSATVKK